MGSINEQGEMAFLEFYRENVKRLSQKEEVYNQGLAFDDNKLLRPFKNDLADLNAGGKKIRGVLVNLGYKMAGHENLEDSDGAALAFEIFQTGVLIHDDIIDKAETRRGKKTMTVRYEQSLKARQLTSPVALDDHERLSQNAAICAGDYLITASNLYLLEHCAGQTHLVEAAAYFDHIILQTIRGEWLDVILPTEMQDQTRQADVDLLMQSIWDIYHLKTAHYSVMGPLHLGLILGGASPTLIKDIDELANEVGIGFQIKDDILGIFADEEELGKDVGSDIAEYKQTILYAYVALNGRTVPEGETESYFDQLLRYYGKSCVRPEEVKAVQTIFRESGALKYAEMEMESCFRRALDKLDTMTELAEEDRMILKGFIDYNRHRRK